MAAGYAQTADGGANPASADGRPDGAGSLNATRRTANGTRRKTFQAVKSPGSRRSTSPWSTSHPAPGAADAAVRKGGPASAASVTKTAFGAKETSAIRSRPSEASSRSLSAAPHGQTTVDGVLVEFVRIIDGVSCAVGRGGRHSLCQIGRSASCASGSTARSRCRRKPTSSRASRANGEAPGDSDIADFCRRIDELIAV